MNEINGLGKMKEVFDRRIQAKEPKVVDLKGPIPVKYIRRKNSKLMRNLSMLTALSVGFFLYKQENGLETAQRIAEQSIERFHESIHPLDNKIMGQIKEAYGQVKDRYPKATAFTEETAMGLASWGKETGSKLWNGMKETGENVGDWFEQKKPEMKAALREVKEETLNLGYEKAPHLIGAVHKMAGATKDLAEKGVDMVQEAGERLNQKYGLTHSLERLATTMEAKNTNDAQTISLADRLRAAQNKGEKTVEKPSQIQIAMLSSKRETR